MPLNLKTEPCKKCGASMVWVLSIAGNPMPIDAKPQRGIKVRVGEDNVARGTSEEFYTSHFATCPYAAEFRRERHV